MKKSMIGLVLLALIAEGAGNAGKVYRPVIIRHNLRHIIIINTLITCLDMIHD